MPHHIRDSALAWLTALAMGLGAVGAFRMLPAPDATWLLHVAGRLLEGDRLGSDIVENTPPVILWMKLPVVLVSRHLSLDPWLAWLAVTTVLVALTVLGVHAVSRRTPTLRPHAGLLTTASAVGLFLVPGIEFGQREHIAIALVLPWLLTVGSRVEGETLPWWGRLLPGVAGGLGLAIKPHFGLVGVAVAWCVVRRLGMRRAVRCGELVVPVVVVAATACVTLLVHPEWLEYARRFGPLYQSFQRSSLWFVALLGEGAEWSWLGLCAFAVFRSSRPTRWDALSVLVAAQVAFHIVAAIQRKGWAYQFLPASVLGLVVAGTAGALAGWPRHRLVFRVYGLAVVLGILAAGVKGAHRTFSLSSDPGARWEDADPSLPALLEAVQSSGEHETLLVLSTNIGSGWPLAHLTGSGWTLRHPALWPLGALYAEELKTPGRVTPHPRSAWNAAEAGLSGDIRADMDRRPPSVIIRVDEVISASWVPIPQRLDYLAFLREDQSARTARCLAGPGTRTGAYTVWRCGRDR